MNPSTAQPLSTGGPSFRTPPVVETALGVQFSELLGFKSVHFGQYYERIKDRFPLIQDQPRLDPIVETFPFRHRPPSFRIAGPSGGPDRTWYLDQDEVCLVQVQPDRFGFNWRSSGESQYPRFAENGPKCLDEFREFCDFCSENNLGPVSPNLCEVVYVNQIRPLDGESAIACFAAVFSGIDWRHSDDWLPAPETASLNSTYSIDGDRGRLYAEASIAQERNGNEYVLLKMTARVINRPEDDVEKSLALAHDWVVNGFVSLTDRTARSQRWNQI